MESEWVNLDVEIHTYRYQSVLVHRDSESYRKFLHWKETNLDSDFEDLAECIEDEVRSDLDFFIENIKEH